VGSLDRIQQAILDAAGGQTALARATVILSSSITPGSTGYLISLNGNVIQASAADGVAVSNGDSVLVAVTGTSRGQSEAFVLCRMSTTGLHPATGTVTTVPPSSPTITVLGADGVSYTAYFLSSYTPVVNDNVEMIFLAGVPYVTKAGATPAPAPATPIGSGASTASSGTTNFPATDSATYWSGLWSSPGVGWGNPSEMYSGTWSGNTMHAAWFYGGGPTQLAGRTITGGRVWIGKREGVGNYNSVANIQIWSHSAGSRPGGDVSLLNGPTSTVAQPWQGLTQYGITQAQAQDLVNGGGLALVNGDYAAFDGVQLNAQSGLVSIDWTR
jgi:hypothetical protein